MSVMNISLGQWLFVGLLAIGGALAFHTNGVSVNQTRYLMGTLAFLIWFAALIVAGRIF